MCHTAQHYITLDQSRDMYVIKVQEFKVCLSNHLTWFSVIQGENRNKSVGLVGGGGSLLYQNYIIGQSVILNQIKKI
jgi:hypothetical protein